MTSSEDAPTTLWAMLGRGEKKVPVVLDGECSQEKGAEVYITYQDGSLFDMHKKKVLWMYTGTTCFCCGAREREILCPRDCVEEGMDDYFSRYNMLKSLEAGQDVRSMSRLELTYHDGTVLSVGMTCKNEKHTAYFRGFAEAVEIKLGLISCKKTSGPGHRAGKPAAVEVATPVEPDAQAAADRHMQELLASENQCSKSAVQRRRKKAKTARQTNQEGQEQDPPSQLALAPSATCIAPTFDLHDGEGNSSRNSQSEAPVVFTSPPAVANSQPGSCTLVAEHDPQAESQDTERESKSSSQSEAPAPNATATTKIEYPDSSTGSCTLLSDSDAQVETDRHMQDRLDFESHSRNSVRQRNRNEFEAARPKSKEVPRERPVAAVDPLSQLALTPTATCSAKAAEAQDGDEECKSHSKGSCKLAAELEVQAEADRHAQKFFEAGSDRYEPKAARPEIQEVLQESFAPMPDQSSRFAGAQTATSSSQRVEVQHGEEELDSTDPYWNSFQLVKGRKKTKGAKVEAKLEVALPPSQGRSSWTQGWGFCEKVQDIDSKSAEAAADDALEIWSSGCNKPCCVPKSLGQGSKRQTRIFTCVPTGPLPAPPETQDTDAARGLGLHRGMGEKPEGSDQGILKQVLEGVKVALGESLARQDQDVKMAQGLGLHWAVEQKPDGNDQAALQKELDRTKTALDESLAQQAELSQLVASLRNELSIAKSALAKSGSMMTLSGDYLEGVGRLQSTCPVPHPPGLRQQSVRPDEPMKVRTSSTCCTRASTDDVSVASTVSCADEDCSGCEVENWPTANADESVINENATLEAMHWWNTWGNDTQVMPW